MKKPTCLIIASLISGSALVALVGCSSTANNSNNSVLAAQLASKPPKEGMNVEIFSGGGTGGYIQGSGSTSCCGAYTGLAYITNSATGTFWFTPIAGTTNCIATDASGFASPYQSVVKVMRKRDGAVWCGTNSISFPASSSEQYRFYLYIKSTPPPPTNGATLTLDVQWNP